jgi:hypothetical protein
MKILDRRLSVRERYDLEITHQTLCQGDERLRYQIGNYLSGRGKMQRLDRRLSVRERQDSEITHGTLCQGEVRFRDYTGDSLSGR